MKNFLVNRALAAKKILITYFSKLCSPASAVQRNDVSTALSMTVGSPSAHRREIPLNPLIRVAAVFALLMTVGIGNAWGTEEIYKSAILSASNCTSNSSYTSSITCTISSDSWTLANAANNNGGWDYVRMGAKKAKAADATKVTTSNVTTSAAYSEAITKVVVTGSLDRGSVTTKLIYASNSGFTTDKVEVTGPTTFSDGKMTFTISSPVASRYYKLEFVCSNTTTSNGVVSLSRIDYYYEATAATPYTVTFTKTDGSTTAITEASVGAGVTPPVMSTPCDGWAFQGWSTSQSTSATSTTVLSTVTLSAGKYYPTANTTLYPVYTKSGGSGFSSYTKVALSGTITSGKYIVSTGSYSKNNSTASGGGSISPSTTEQTSYELTITKYNTYFTIQLSNGNYLGATSSTTIQSTADGANNTNYQWTYNSNGIYCAAQSRYMRANSTTDFRNYKTDNSYSGSTLAYLYKRTEAAASYYYSYPSCAACTATPTVGDASLKGAFSLSSVGVTVTCCKSFFMRRKKRFENSLFSFCNMPDLQRVTSMPFCSFAQKVPFCRF